MWPSRATRIPDGASIIDPDGVGGKPPWDMARRESLIRAKAAELTAAGATAVREESDGEHLDHIVMLDPEGNEFCIA